MFLFSIFSSISISKNTGQYKRCMPNNFFTEEATSWEWRKPGEMIMIWGSTYNPSLPLMKNWFILRILSQMEVDMMRIPAYKITYKWNERLILADMEIEWSFSLCFFLQTPMLTSFLNLLFKITNWIFNQRFAYYT